MAFTRRRIGRKSRFSKKRRATAPLSRRQVKAVRTIAKAVDFKNDESKAVTAYIGSSGAAWETRSWNLTTFATGGTGSDDMIGRSCHYDTLTLRGTATRKWLGTDADIADAYARVMILWADAEVANSSNISLFDIFVDKTYQASGTVGLSNGIVDTSKVRVVYDRMIHLKPSVAKQQASAFINIKKKLNRKITYKTDPAAGNNYAENSKGNLYYVVITDTPIGVTTGQQPTIQTGVNMRLTYKDA